ncbi:type VII toxin-antitoxin system MntA family adenylyltransferase antitoxin [Natronolimnohabitans innermongolicus]|uniref:DNA polymerase beta domain-containing protein n=1 Tax=Natronolimnohabitans innermongolicus JCM 12255 TaxID=1227499 RepID=L9XH93_9EURY|nr:nucleotidyltransferase domain-containing protein [Natronolimnohabitans innermongolicus]ELY61109.1 DNA polymerase beta domain-containing protein [Natronolimnohabitans innermongolicus JCM 12255]
MREDPHESAAEIAASIDLEGLRSLFADADVRYAVVFGSHAAGTESPTSDIDLGVRFAEGCSRRERFRQRNRIDAESQSYAAPFVDVSDIEALPETVALNALRNGICIYGDTETRAADERRLERRVEASSDRRERQRQEFIDRLAEGDV